MFATDIFKALPLGLIICLGTADSSLAQTFHGKLSKQLSIDTSIGSVLLWDRADPGLAPNLNVAPSTIAEFSRGDLKFGKLKLWT